ncbi:hypothetical protein R5N98_02700 [Tenacibaculum maritimum]|uniref:hypothetical protein n=1 Tax=Tenacibaculum maritimum TaxID=107401 RepID=UPI003876A2CF
MKKVLVKVIAEDFGNHEKGVEIEMHESTAKACVKAKKVEILSNIEESSDDNSSELNGLNSELASVKDELTKAKEDLETKNSELASVKDELTKAKEDLNSVQDQLKKSEEALKKANTEIQKLKK